MPFQKSQIREARDPASYEDVRRRYRARDNFVASLPKVKSSKPATTFSPQSKAPLQRAPIKLEWMLQTPPEFNDQRVSEARRQATALMNAACRTALKRLGFDLSRPVSPVWPPKEDFEAEAEARSRGHDPHKVYTLPPMPLSPRRRIKISASLPALVSSSKDRANIQSEGVELDTKASASPPLPRYRPLPKRDWQNEKKENLVQLWQFGRGSSGNPYTLSQIHEVIEARIADRPIRDVRAPIGRLGSAILGPGASRLA
eukprot:CAMPEP_0206548962 /NCGR_PEP_ID=MMETSP0325_2-20121206/14188_1 /ASSEMBLY_ACC=CAM_ASM_000347 /TAXON_ID=2866 /ORGANISM="Crypthecodinium cohnii, Strain Seligo" /LENGTH=257 /DNA_ID=CAMNT_0054048527 /DNA_START=39 /DNA_END=810 /DNA_ORIENTATION=+